MALVKNAGRVFKEDLEHEVQSGNGRDHDMDVRIGTGSYKNPRLAGSSTDGHIL
jgi:hypothetical protein